MAHTKTNKYRPIHRIKSKLHPRHWWRKVLIIIVVLVMFCVSSMYGIARWYMAKHASEPFNMAATFIPDYAESFGLDKQQTMDAMINDLGIKHLRLVSYWENGEATRDVYDFSFLDWQMQKARENGVKVSLAIGLRQPRWPECHMPTWAAKLPKSQWEPQLFDYIEAVVNRYRNDPALESWQLENEYFLKVFGICPDHSRDRLVDEFDLVKRLDKSHPLIVSRSNNAIGWPKGEPQPDISAVSVYKRVWDKTITRRYFEYPIPAWYYGFLAGWNELVNGNDTIIHELQAEAWLPDGFEMQTAPISELDKSLSPQRLQDRFEYGRSTGMRTMTLWGVEWWYYMKEKRNDPDLWNVAKEEIQKSQ